MLIHIGVMVDSLVSARECSGGVDGERKIIVIASELWLVSIYQSPLEEHS